MFENVFIDNSIGCQVFDSGIDNNFELNYFDDWVSPDDDFDNIVDAPYPIDWDANNQDLYRIADLNPITTIVTETTDEGSTSTSDSGETVDIDEISPIIVGVIAGAVVIPVE